MPLILSKMYLPPPFNSHSVRTVLVIKDPVPRYLHYVQIYLKVNVISEGIELSNLQSSPALSWDPARRRGRGLLSSYTGAW